MGSLFDWTLAAFAVGWLTLAIGGVSRQFKRGDPLNWLVGLGGFLVVSGAAGFFGAMLSAVGMLRLPSSFEWPAGFVDGVVALPGGSRAVPLEPSGRLQIYDPDWHYLRGWHIAAEGGPFKIADSQPGKIEVYTLRGRHHFTYSEDGQLLANETYTQPYGYVPSEGTWQVVPTFPLLWPFSSPFLSVGLGVIGGLVLGLSKWFRNPPDI